LGLTGDSRYNFRNVYHLTAGALFDLGTDFQFRPSLLVTYSESLRPQAEVSAMFFVKRVFGVGVNARSYGYLAGMAQFSFAGLGIGYSYQFNAKNEPLNRSINNSTHEIGLSYRFGGAVGLLYKHTKRIVVNFLNCITFEGASTVQTKKKLVFSNKLLCRAVACCVEWA